MDEIKVLVLKNGRWVELKNVVCIDYENNEITYEVLKDISLPKHVGSKTLLVNEDYEVEYEQRIYKGEFKVISPEG